ncbi:Indole-3-glycerol phosphate synthase [Candidatus Tremblaya princeps]|uniref:indole-3-glycerol-phosphate synthase n=1 Tax=Tremblaya princeps TaxID=189385 RepID=A0A143WNM2_TREPR|nr:Indole-3-glycerol phosphate synthase [Candidatus Tremblaya princeps]
MSNTHVIDMDLLGRALQHSSGHVCAPGARWHGGGFAEFYRRLAADITAGCASVVSEVKRASPREGGLRDRVFAQELSRAMELRRAACVSVLTEHRLFGGHGSLAIAMGRLIGTPILWKDFVASSEHVAHALAMGADVVLLVAAMHCSAALREVQACAHSHGLGLLYEVHSHADVDKIAPLYPSVVGINSRNLRTFLTGFEAAYAVMSRLPASCAVVMESGVCTHDSARGLRRRLVRGFIVGELLSDRRGIYRRLRWMAEG